MADPAAVGRIRRRAVEIGGSVHLPVALPQRLEELFCIVREGAAPEAQAVKNRMPASVPAADHAHFVQLALAEFGALHAGNAVRFGIRPLEFEGWQKRYRGAT